MNSDFPSASDQLAAELPAVHLGFQFVYVA
jgi:hypothetical protein